MSKTCCPWCGAHSTAAERRNIQRGLLPCCTLCGRPVRAHRSKKRCGMFCAVLAALCALNFVLLAAEVPLAAVAGFTASAVAVLWLLRGWTIVIEKQ